MIDMVGIGPFIVTPVIIQELNGPHFLLAWLLGAVIALIDGFIWAELGAAYPRAGGSYAFLKELFGKDKLGKYFSFLFIWQTSIQAPLVVASGAIGFAGYAAYLYPLTSWQQKAVSGSLVILLVFLLYRKTKSIAKFSTFLWVGVLGMLGWLILSGLMNFNAANIFPAQSQMPEINFAFTALLGAATVKTIYTYLGYYNVCHLGSEIDNPGKNIPSSIIISILAITAIYLLMQLSVVSVFSYHPDTSNPVIISVFFEKLYGKSFGVFATVMILWIAFASLYAVLLGYTRIPYAAAVEGDFFKVFARTHKVHEFPTVSLLVLGALGFSFSLLFKLKDVITAILAMRILIQFIGQTIGLILLHKNRPSELVYKMPFYPLPAIINILAWSYLFYSTGTSFMLGGLGIITLGSIVYLIRAKSKGFYPFQTTTL